MSQPKIKGGMVLFDGVCSFCNRSVEFIRQRDPADYFRFASLQSSTAQALLPSHALTSAESMILLEGDRVYRQSAAVIRILWRLGGLWPLLAALVLIPRPLRDLAYRWFARNRYRWFGKVDSCSLPTPESKQAGFPFCG